MSDSLAPGAGWYEIEETREGQPTTYTVVRKSKMHEILRHAAIGAVFRITRHETHPLDADV